MTYPTMIELDSILKNQFGFETFREGQIEAISTLMEKDRLLCIQPTGYGKSLLYQMPTVLLDGITLVISPLLALMRDQITHLTKRFDIPAASINSDQSEGENVIARKEAETGKLRILFVAPEQLEDIERFKFLLTLPVSLVVIDEAHCISTWGHDFRPSYRQIVQLIRSLEKNNRAVKVLGLTATANQKTEEDIKRQLETIKPVIVHRTGMDRPNIQLSVIPVSGIAEKLVIIKQLLSKMEGDGLIYCATRENTELVAEYCQTKNIKIVAYHAGMDSSEKRILQNDFMLGKYRVIAATNALGMGIDKPDLRFIIHFDVPSSITAYYQEVGRCGRDGLLANGVLLFDIKDKKIQQHFINSAQPNEQDFYLVLDIVEKSKEPTSLMTIKRLTGMHPTRVTVVVAELIEQNLLQKYQYNGRQVYIRGKSKDVPDLTRYINQYQVKTQELESMLHYGIQKDTCRMFMLRDALGDKQASPCGHCDVCTQQLYVEKIDVGEVANISNWLAERVVNIKAVHINKISTGVAVLDAKLRSPLFIQFMKQRIKSNTEDLGLSDELFVLIKHRLAELSRKHNFEAVLPIPSRTWGASNRIAELIAKQLNVSVLLNTLIWREVPLKRQGELLNNDQRRYNIDHKMTIKEKPLLIKGDILLLDDYIGSGITIKEAVRVLRKEAGVSQEIVPFTIAMVKWRLGQQGMV